MPTALIIRLNFDNTQRVPYYAMVSNFDALALSPEGLQKDKVQSLNSGLYLFIV